MIDTVDSFALPEESVSVITELVFAFMPGRGSEKRTISFSFEEFSYFVSIVNQREEIFSRADEMS